jgi:hypothetical protein
MNPVVPVPGDVGFNGYVRRTLLQPAMGTAVIGCDRDKDGNKQDQAYQTVIQKLVETDICKRLLVYFATGLGKTRTMLIMLDALFNDKRPKIVLFETTSQVDNFLGELIDNDNMYGTFVRNNHVGKKPPTTGEIRDLIALKGKLKFASTPGWPAAPLRIFTYSRAGGASAFGKARDVAFNWAKAKRNVGNPFNGTIVIGDEAHNLTNPPVDTDGRRRQRYKKVARALSTSTNTNCYLLTATPYSTVFDEARALLDVVKGDKNKNRSDEGFMTMYTTFFGDAFPTTTPTDPRSSLPTVIPVPIDGHALDVYRKKVKAHKKTHPRVSERDHAIAVAPYLNLARSYRSLPQSYLAKLRANLMDESPKFARVMYYLDTHSHVKTVMLMHRSNAMKALVDVIAHRRGLHAHHGQVEESSPTILTTLIEKEDKVKLDRYNADVVGTKRRMLIADTKSYAESVSMFNVREMILVDVPTTTSLYVQEIGRTIRLCSHVAMPKGLRKLQITMFVGVVPGEKSADVVLAEHLEKDLASRARIDDKLRAIAIDGVDVYTHLNRPQKPRSRSRSSSRSKSRSKSKSRSRSRSRSHSQSRSRSGEWSFTKWLSELF